MLSKVSLLSISFYQKFISPKKGYRCAYGVLHGTHGCSGHVKNIIKTKGVLAGIPDIKGQFASCKMANIEIKRRRDKKKDRTDDFCDGLDCCLDVTSCLD